MKKLMVVFIPFLAFLVQVSSSVSKVRKVHFNYPVKLLPPITGIFFSTNLTNDELVCFGNRDYSHPTYFMTLLCMLPFTPDDYCFTVWGSRSIVINASGSIELLKLSTTLPHESINKEVVPVNATRWLELPIDTANRGVGYREIVQIHAEPINLCVRSNDWKGGNGQFNITFGGAYLRENDKRDCHEKTLMHIGIIFALSSVWLLPYVAAMAVSVFTFLHGLQIVLVLFAVSAFVLCLAPLMLTKRNRYLTRLYYNYFFTRISAEDTQTVIRLQLPVFQALFFSSSLICGGSLFAYLLYYHGGVDREMRNMLLKLILSMAIGWFVFFVCRFAERFFRDWLWLAMCVGLAQMMDPHLNPLSRDKVVVAAMAISLVILQGLGRLMRTSAARNVERLASPSLVQLADVMGIRVSEKQRHHHRRHHLHKSAPSPLRIESTGHRTSLDGTDLSVPDGDQLSPVAEDLRRSLAALRFRGVLSSQSGQTAVFAVDEELAGNNAVCLVAVSMHSLGPLFVEVEDGKPYHMLLPLLTTNIHILKSLQRISAVIAADRVGFHTSSHGASSDLDESSGVTVQISLSSTLMETMGLRAGGVRSLVVRTTVERARSRHVDSVLAAVAATLGICTPSVFCKSVVVDFVDDSSVVAKDASPSVLLRVTVPALLTKAQCVAAWEVSKTTETSSTESPSSRALVWSMFVGQNNTVHSADFADAANRSLSIAVTLAVLSFYEEI